MKKTLWALSALALVGFAFTGCNNECESNDDCDEGQFCIEALVAGEDTSGESDGVEVGEMFCSECLTDCAADPAHSVCVASLHVCGASATCPSGMVMTEKNGFAECISDSLKPCTSNNDCEDGMVCGSDNFCTVDNTPRYKFVRIDDLSAAGEGWDPGADIDAIVLDGSIYATAIKDFKRSDSVKIDDKHKHFAADPQKALGKPDSLVSYPSTGSCNYFRDGSNSVAQKKCDLDGTKGVADASCDYDYSFVSLGGQGGYLIVEMGGEIKAGSKIDVIELGDCSLANTAGGSTNKAKAEEIKVSVAVSSDLNGDWKAIGNKAATGGIASFTVSGNML